MEKWVYRANIWPKAHPLTQVSPCNLDRASLWVQNKQNCFLSRYCKCSERLQGLFTLAEKCGLIRLDSGGTNLIFSFSENSSCDIRHNYNCSTQISNTCSGPGTMIVAWSVVLTIALQGRYWSLHFREEKTEVSRLIGSKWFGSRGTWTPNRTLSNTRHVLS